MTYLCYSSTQIRDCVHWSRTISLVVVKKLCMFDERFVQWKIIKKVPGGYLIEFQIILSKLHWCFIREYFRVRHEKLCSSAKVISSHRFYHLTKRNKQDLYICASPFVPESKMYCKISKTSAKPQKILV